MTEKQTVAGAYAKIESHERECALRYQALETGIADLKLGGRWIIALLSTVAVSVIGWLAIQVYDLNREQSHQADRPEMVASVAPMTTVSLESLSKP